MNITNTKSPKPIYIALFLICFSFFVYYPVLSHHFMIDDFGFTNTEVMFDFFQSWTDFFTKSINRHYEPIFNLWNTYLFQIIPVAMPFYFINIVLISLSSFLSYILINQLCLNWRISLLTAALFIIHPLTAISMQHILINSIILSTIFMQLSLICLIQSFEHPRKVLNYLLSLIFFIMALLTQEISILFPFYVIALLWFRFHHIKTIFKITFPYIVVSIAHLILWFYIVGPNARLAHNFQEFNLDIWTYFAGLANVISWYVKRLFFPDGIVFIFNHIHFHQNIRQWNLLFWSSLFIIIYLIFFYFKKRIESLALLVFLGGFLICIPVSTSRYWLGFIIEPNWFFFSSIGFYLFLSLTLFKLKTHIHSNLFLILVAAIFFYFNFYTQRINFIAREEFIYCEHWLRYSPQNLLPMVRLAYYYGNSDLLDIPDTFIPQFISRIDAYTKLAPKSDAIKLIKKLLTYPINDSDRQRLLQKLAGLI